MPMHPWLRSICVCALLGLFLAGLLSRGEDRLPAQVVHAETERVLQRLGVDRWHQAGWRGQGIRVAVLDSGFRGLDARAGVSLPARMQTASFRQDGDLAACSSLHGLLCAEIIHALAPAAELLLVNWEPDMPDAFLRAVAWAKAQEAQIISCSIVMPSWSDGHGGGRVHAKLQSILDGVLMVAAAGNLGQRHWQGRVQCAADGFVQWQPTVHDNPIQPWGDRPVSIEWTSQSGLAVDLRVIEVTSGRSIGYTDRLPSVGIHGGAVRFWPQAHESYVLRAKLPKGATGELRIVALGSDLGITTRAGSVVFPADGKVVLGVSAVESRQQSPRYASWGGAQARLDLAAQIPFPCPSRRRPFTGTSAAAPQVAGLAALCWSQDPSQSVAAVRQRLLGAARDVPPMGLDHATGAGLLCLPSPAGR